jgi:uncharacterized protein YfdQ (DUF2303 family)
MITHEAIQKIIDLSSTGQLVQAPEAYHPVAIEGSKLVGLEQFAKAPYQVTEDRQLPSLKAFTDYLTAFKQNNTVVFADVVAQKLQAVIDYHAPVAGEDPKPSWCRHKAAFKLDMDEDFAHFLKLNKQPLEQDDLVIQLTDYAPHFVIPAAADVLALVGDVQLVDNKELASQVGSGGLSTLYKQDKKLKAKGAIDFPEVFIVALPVFKGFATRYQLGFRLLWKCGEDTRGKLVFQIRLVRPHAILEAAFQDVCKQVTDTVTVPVYGADPALTSTTTK